MANRIKFTPRVRAKFLEVLRHSANVTMAAEAAGMSRRSLYDHKAADPAFANDWAEAEEMAVDRLEAEAWRRATEGTKRPVYQGGKEVGYVMEYSDRLAEMLLKGHRSYRFKDRVETQLASPTGGDAKLIVEYRDPTKPIG